MIDENIRAQPPAREDAQPFGYWVEHRSGENPVLIRYGSFVPASDHYKITTLYTHAATDAQPVWVDGIPTKHHAKEWFIAETTFGDRVVLTALPEEYAYDFKTADETYIKADRIKRWMPFPDSQYLFPHPAPDALREDLNRKHEACQIAQDQAMENGSRAREAERKLAEAVELLKQALGDMDRRVITAETANRIDYFISKEAERG